MYTKVSRRFGGKRRSRGGRLGGTPRPTVGRDKRSLSRRLEGGFSSQCAAAWKAAFPVSGVVGLVDKEHFAVFGKRPAGVVDEVFEGIDCVA